jgi:hypothetical protein
MAAAAAGAAERTAPTIDRRQLILTAAGLEVATFLEPADAFDDCLVGAAANGSGEMVAVYNKMAVIVALSKADACTFEEAFDRFEKSYGTNAEIRLQDAGKNDLPQLPLFIVDLRDMA